MNKNDFEGFFNSLLATFLYSVGQGGQGLSL